MGNVKTGCMAAFLIQWKIQVKKRKNKLKIKIFKMLEKIYFYVNPMPPLGGY